ncbi:aquaporin-7-like [Eublepharis macularius]|uniref:Aquaporin-7-like n=1 Tax=Eublepharis macularius TaxID=481883 RepID=A0AA97L7W2_EUBMA|nr:aquaporin-7-like [Eublepharis macularius]XP_054842882.1 aquaporin-7-like [Eublepharis macularius]
MPETNMLEKLTHKLAIKNEMIREGLAEALSTFLLMLFGNGSVAQAVLGRQNFGTFLSINLGYGFGVMMGIHAAGGISGAHMNAAITSANCVVGNLPWRKLPAYVIGQFLGSFIASATVFLMYYDALMDYAGGNLTVTGPTATAGIFATYPAPYMSLWRGFLHEFISTAVLVIGILAIHDKRNAAALPGTNALTIGLLVAGIGMSMGMNTGYAINPSRDLPPRIFTALAGWGLEVFTAGNCWWWVPVVAPILGSVVGIFIYNIFIDFHNRPLMEPDSGNEKGKQNVELVVSTELQNRM